MIFLNKILLLNDCCKCFFFFVFLTSHTHMNTLQITHDLFHYFCRYQPSFLTSIPTAKLLPCGCWWFCWYLCYMVKRLELCVFGVVIIIFGLSRFPQRVMNTFGMLFFCSVKKSFLLFIFESAFKVYYFNKTHFLNVFYCIALIKQEILLSLLFTPSQLYCLNHKYFVYVIRYIDISGFSLQWTSKGY